MFFPPSSGPRYITVKTGEGVYWKQDW